MRKIATVTIRLTKEQKDKLAIKAEAAGMNTSEYLRYLVLKDLGEIK